MYNDDNYGSNRSPFGCARLAIALLVIGWAAISYFSTSSVNPVTGEKQHVALNSDQEIAIGLQAVPEMENQYGGEISYGMQAAKVQEVGARLLSRSDANRSPYKFQFHLLADPNTVNAFALPGGQVFITKALMDRLKTDGQLAGVLGHEMGHVVDRHGAQQMAKRKFANGVSGAAVIATYDPYDRRSYARSAVIQMVSQLVQLKYGRNDEIAADRFGVRFSAEAGYDPHAMLGVMQILAELSKGGRTPEMLSTHPDPGNRADRIKKEIQEEFPNGVPGGLEP